MALRASSYLCYHGVSQADEHEGTRELYLPAERFRHRMSAIRDGGYHVLPLSEALDRLTAGTLPPRAVSLTFDDGFVDFLRVAYPILSEFALPATVYVSTEYVEHQFPVFPPILLYLLWRARGQSASGDGIVADGARLETRTEGERETTYRRILKTLHLMNLESPEQRDDFAARLADRLNVDYVSIKSQRLFHLMTRQEVAAGRLVDVQLHTHRHTQPHDQHEFRREILDNRNALAQLFAGSSSLKHFCYPNGETRPELPGWLRRERIVSATTCVPGLAERNHDPLLLPRFVDTQGVSPLKFEAWLCGAAALLPQRNRHQRTRDASWSESSAAI